MRYASNNSHSAKTSVVKEVKNASKTINRELNTLSALDPSNRSEKFYGLRLKSAMMRSSGQEFHRKMHSNNSSTLM